MSPIDASLKFNVIKYSDKLANCPICNKLLEPCISTYLSIKGKNTKCIHKKCNNCNINYVKDNLYVTISSSGKNPNVILNSIVPPMKQDEGIQMLGKKEKLHLVTYAKKIKSCPKCDNKLITCNVNYITYKDKEKECCIRKCNKCNINYVHWNTFVTMYADGKNHNIVLDSSLSVPPSIDKKEKVEVKPKVTINTVIKPKITTTIVKKPVITKTLDGVVIYKSINNSCKKNHSASVKQIPLELKNAKTGYPQSVYGFYCEKCSKKFITFEAITKYTYKYYIPQFKCILSNEFSGDLREVSMLKMYGYTAQAGALSDRQRRAIIDFVIDYKIMSPMDVINLLEFLIKLNGNMRNKQDACEIWHSDIQYVYKIK